MVTIDTGDARARAVVAVIRRGDVDGLRDLLTRDPELATSRLGDDDPDGMSRSLLHVATDWPGHFPNGPETVAVLVEAGADVNARFRGFHNETPLHWAASSNDVAVLDALLDLGADIDATGAVIAGGTPLRDAVAFGNQAAARRLVERGAEVGDMDAAGLGLLSELQKLVGASPAPEQLNRLFWSACHGGQLETAAWLLDQGAEIDWIPDWEDLTPLDAAARDGHSLLLTWLHERGAHTASDIHGC